MRRTVLTWVLVVGLAGAAAAQVSVCGTGPLALTGAGERLGDPWFLQIDASPGSQGLLAIAPAANPTLTPAGVICFDPGSAVWLPFTVPASGAVRWSGLLPLDVSAIGARVVFQAGIADVQAPSGVSLSPSLRATYRPPMRFFRDYLTHEVTAVDLLNRAIHWRSPGLAPSSILPGASGVQMIFDEERDLLIQSNGRDLALIDVHNGVRRATITLPPIGNFHVRVLPGINGLVIAATDTREFRVLDLGTFTVGSPLPTPFPLTAFMDLIPIRGTTRAWVAGASALMELDFATGTVVRTQPRSPSNSLPLAVFENRMLDVARGPGLNDQSLSVYDRSSGSLVVQRLQLPAASAIGGSLQGVVGGPGSSGSGYWVQWRGSTASGPFTEVIELDPDTLLERQRLVLPFQTALASNPSANSWSLVRQEFGPPPPCAIGSFPTCTNPPTRVELVAFTPGNVHPLRVVGSLPLSTYPTVFASDSRSLPRTTLMTGQNSLLFLDGDAPSSTAGAALVVPGATWAPSEVSSDI